MPHHCRSSATPNQTKPQVVEINAWLVELLTARAKVVIPEITNYEVRRELIRAGKSSGVRRLDELIKELHYLPLDTETIRRAAELWAQARNAGLPTAPPEALDGDVILAAQAE